MSRRRRLGRRRGTAFKRLFTQVYVHLLGMLALVGIVTGAVFANGFRTAYLHGLAERMVRHGASLVADHFQDPGSRARTVRRLADELEVDVTVRDPSGRALDVAGPALPPLGPVDAQAVLAGATTLAHFHNGWYAAAPIVDGKTGALLGTIQSSPVRHMRPPSILRPVITVALVLLIVAMSAAPLARRISRPVERLTEATLRFGSGDLGYRVDVDCREGRRNDELSRLTHAWNEMAKRVENLVRGQKELLANVSHELRSPLARIRVALELLPHDAASEARLRDVELDLAELDRLIDDVLTTSRLEATGLPAHLGTVAVEPLLAQLAERSRHDPLVAGKEVRVTVAPDAPRSLVADGALVKRALWNLVENAGKYGAAPITVAAAAASSPSGPALALSVSDEGAGISAADRERVFAAFFRADKARTPSGPGEAPRGFGLGLTIARRVAEVHGGRILVEPAHTGGGVERGCKVTIELPLRAPAKTA